MRRIICRSSERLTMFSVARIVYFFSCLVLVVHGMRSLFRYKYNDINLIDRGEKFLNIAEEHDDSAFDFPQKLDHFNILDQRVWNQRHWRKTNYYELNGPVFLFLGGENKADPFMLTISEWSQYAVEHRAMLFLLEHRFYGYSQPFEHHNTSVLQYLNAEQALADVAYFIESMNREHHMPEGTKWIVFGGSYAGSLAAWARVKYPHLIHAAYASSAPLLAKANFKEYYAAVEEALESYDVKCVVNIKRANALLSKMIRSKQGKEDIKDIFNLCDNLKKRNDIITFFGFLIDTLGAVVQYHNQLRTLNINSVCDIMAASTEDDISTIYQLATVIKRTGPPERETECISTNYDEMIGFYQNITNTLQFNRAWFYQTCTEYGYFATQDKKSDLFGPHIPLQYFTKMCQDVFGSSFDRTLLDEAVLHTNRVFGHLNINTTNILFVHGSVDPWRTLGITETNSYKSHQVVYIQGASHCADLWQTSFKNEEMHEVGRKISDAINSWFQSAVEGTSREQTNTDLLEFLCADDKDESSCS